MDVDYTLCPLLLNININNSSSSRCKKKTLPCQNMGTAFVIFVCFSVFFSQIDKNTFSFLISMYMLFFLIIDGDNILNLSIFFLYLASLYFGW